MIETENKFIINPYDLKGAEKQARLDTVQELLDGYEQYKIKELKSGDNLHRVFQFSIEDDSDKTLTIDDIKKIFNDRYGFDEGAIILRKDSIPFDSGICKAGDVIHVYINIAEDLKIKELKKSMTENKSHTKNENAEKLESPYKKMIEAQEHPIDGDPNKSQIAITIDDGYNSHGNLEKILNILDKWGIKATFFALGEVISWNKDIWQSIKDKGHQICCHTYSHAYIENSKITDLFKGHGIPSSERPKLVKQREGYVKNLLGKDEYNNIKRRSGPGFPRKVDTTALLDAEIRMWEFQVERSLGKDYLLKMKRDFPFFRFPGKIGANRPENIQVLKDHGYLSIGWTHESGKDKNNIKKGGIELLHVNDDIANNLDEILDSLGIQGTQVTNIIEPK